MRSDGFNEVGRGRLTEEVGAAALHTDGDPSPRGPSVWDEHRWDVTDGTRSVDTLSPAEEVLHEGEQPSDGCTSTHPYVRTRTQREETQQVRGRLKTEARFSWNFSIIDFKE